MRPRARTTLRRCAPGGHDLKEMRPRCARPQGDAPSVRTTSRRCALGAHDLKEMRPWCARP
ncbi:hypothetical protein LP422_03970 [Janibacter limosus]|uniref:Uncharacterized protein n=1 Tax=Janibacter limosus TaxID=53458 RepID=A0AC61U5N7_9MICO|nr:hypothetical protein [Janibacter limosus]UUZ45362.1 hypothetical protein LP422_03970 [Janibacter limosus]